MAEEKLLNEEIISDEKLDAVAGGSVDEIQDDANRLRQLGYLGSEGVTKQQIRNAFGKLGLYIGVTFDDNKRNTYYAPGKYGLQEVSRDVFWDYINQQLKKY